ncbi:MAG: hypothetical protein PGN16_13750 [Sphingomonas phyllosphaerae]|uniref:hypothetical protein n=1 Tax=Sphingomonas phyllosphaerae TaxID=257003 RepID=UPI002FF6EC7C
MLAMQAIELWLNAYLLHHGVSAEALRGMQHDLAGRGDLAETIGLRLRRRTLAHLHELSSRREYLITRYGSELLGSWTQINRLVATLEEVATKVSEATRAGRSDLRAAPSAPCRTSVSHPVPAAAAS